MTESGTEGQQQTGCRMAEADASLQDLLRQFAELKEWQREQEQKLLEEQMQQKAKLQEEKRRLAELLLLATPRGQNNEGSVTNGEDETSQDVDSDLEGIESLPETESEEEKEDGAPLSKPNEERDENSHPDYDDEERNSKEFEMSDREDGLRDGFNQESESGEEEVFVMGCPIPFTYQSQHFQNQDGKGDISPQIPSFPDSGHMEETLPPLPQVSFEETPITPSKKRFEEMLEAELQKNSDEASDDNNGTKIKQPFLRRGQGLARFRMGPFAENTLEKSTKGKDLASRPRPWAINSAASKTSLNGASAKSNGSKSSHLHSCSKPSPTSYGSRTSLVRASSKSSLVRAGSKTSLTSAGSLTSLTRPSSKAGLTPASSKTNLTSTATNSNSSSKASVDNSKSTPFGTNKKAVPSIPNDSPRHKELESPNPKAVSVGVDSNANGNMSSTDSGSDSGSDLMAVPMKRTVYRPHSATLGPAKGGVRPAKVGVRPTKGAIVVEKLKDDTKHQKKEERELAVFEYLEDAAEDSSFCSSSSTMLRLLDVSSPNNSVSHGQKPPTYYDYFTQSKRVYQLAQESPIDEGKSKEESLHVHFSETTPERHEYTACEDDDDTLDTDDTLEADEDAVSSSVIVEEKLPRNPSPEKAADDAPKIPSPTTQDDVELTKAVLHARVVEMEQEIAALKRERVAAEKERVQQELAARKVRQESLEWARKKADEEAKIAEGKAALRRERNLLERKEKELRERLGGRGDREEAKLWREKFAELEEEGKRKEARWAAAQARLKERVKQLEEENKRVKDEVMALRKPHGLGKGGNLTPGLSSSSKHKMLEQNRPKLLVKDQMKIVDVRPTKDIPNSYFNSLPTAKMTSKPPMMIPSKKPLTKTLNAKPVTKSGASTTSMSKDSLDGSAPGFCDSLEGSTESLPPNQQCVGQEVIMPDGHKEIHFSSGKVQSVSRKGDSYTIRYFNGDLKETLGDGTVRYFYKKTSAWNTTYPDGLNVVEFPDGQVERQLKDGTVEVTFPNGSMMLIRPDGSKENMYPDGVVVHEDTNGNTTLSLPNGQREIHTPEYKSREYPDGTVKTIYSDDGRQETKYPSGRVRVRDAQGNLILDAQA